MADRTRRFPQQLKTKRILNRTPLFLTADVALSATATLSVPTSYGKISFFDMEATVTPPNGYAEAVPVTLGANWQPNDIRFLFICAEATGDSDSTTTPIAMFPDPPTGFTPAFSLNPGFETKGVYYRRLVAGDADASIAFPKPQGWREYMFATVTARGVDPATAPIAAETTPSYTGGDTSISVASVTVPAVGTMVLFLGTLPNPGGGQPSWAVATGVPTGWSAMVATDKSGATYYPFDANPSLNLVGKSYATSGTTGAVLFPAVNAAPAMAGMYMFVRPAPDVSVSIGAA